MFTSLATAGPSVPSSLLQRRPRRFRRPRVCRWRRGDPADAPRCGNGSAASNQCVRFAVSHGSRVHETAAPGVSLDLSHGVCVASRSAQDLSLLHNKVGCHVPLRHTAPTAFDVHLVSPRVKEPTLSVSTHDGSSLLLNFPNRGNYGCEYFKNTDVVQVFL